MNFALLSRNKEQEKALKFPYSDAARGTDFVLEYFESIMEDSDIKKVWLKNNCLLQVFIKEPDIAIYADTRNNQISIFPGIITDESPHLTLTLEADHFHRIYAGKMNVMMAFASRKIKTKGKTSIIMKTIWTLPKAISIYKDLLKKNNVYFFKDEEAKIKKSKLKDMGGSTVRVKRLLRELVDAPLELCAERAVLLTESFKLTENEPSIHLRYGKALRYILENIPVNIYEDELIIGTHTSKRKGSGLFPEGIGVRLDDELDVIGYREGDPYKITPGDIARLREQVFPYWKDKNIEVHARQMLDTETEDYIDRVGFFILTEFAGTSHLTLNHDKALKYGYQGLIELVENRKKDFDGSTGKQAFLEGVIETLLGGIEFAKRYSKKAIELAEREKNPERKEELEILAEICQKIPESPPETFYEALQMIWFSQMIALIESYEFAISVGRFDKLLYPFYKRDVESGDLTREKALELVEGFYIKTSAVYNCLDADVRIIFDGNPIGLNITLGPEVNELTRVAVEAMNNIRSRNPNVTIRINKESPDEFLLKVSEYVRTGTMLQFMNDDVIIPAFIKRGITEEDAREYSIIGCVEPMPTGLSFGSTDAGLMNLALPLELALNNGKGRVFDEQCGPETGDPREFNTFDQLIGAFDIQLTKMIERAVKGLNILGEVQKLHKPTPFISAMIDDCIEKGLDVTQGGARYNFTGVQGVGIPSVGDSLTAVKKLVFDEKKITMDELLAGLDSDFENDPRLRELLINRAPKYGNDDDYADAITRTVSEMYCNGLTMHKNIRGGIFHPGAYSVSAHVVFGTFVGALPSGRIARTPLSNGITPCHGSDTLGPTASIKSVSKLNHGDITNGSAYTPLFSPKGAKASLLAPLIRTYADLGGYQIQFNFIDKKILLDAQKNPDRHRGLVVRVAGYSALFTELSKATQDDIINRTEFKCG
ncbi:MAG: formate C-acetyltransferase/glycerol dehydratase family glycyl radical enzyme [Candidatus Odinarchaeota archaeon]